MDKNISGVYIISAIKGSKCYIGSSKNIKERISDHWSALRNNRHENKKIQNYFNKYGQGSLIFNILELCDKEMLEEREVYHVNMTKPWFNIIKDVKRNKGFFKHTKAAKEKIRKASKKMWAKQKDKMIDTLKLGEENGFAKMTNEQVKNLKIDLLDSNNRIFDLMIKYKLSKTQILHIKNGKWWKHIFPELTDDLKKVERVRKKKCGKFITEESVEKLKLEILECKLTLQELANKYNISKRSVIAIKQGTNWNYVLENKNEEIRKVTLPIKKRLL